MLTRKPDHAFRADIEGLRALAIVPILVLHSGYEWLRGGFVGVDVFFVISGYLITGNLTRELDAGRFSLARFYHRRAIRILPALAVTLAVTALASLVLLYPIELADFGRSMAASAGFAANFYFDRTADYFAGTSQTKPLIHMWSLGVEEQFYLAWPLILWLLWRHGQPARRPLWLGAIALISLAIGAWSTCYAPQSAYYLITSRAWELLCGGFVALGCVPRIARTGLRQALCLAAITGLALAAWQTRGSMLFPVPQALLPVGATAVLIAYGEHAWTARLLRLAPMRLVGRLSYALYLVHRPLIAFVTLRYGATLPVWRPALLITGSLALAALLHVAIENPLRSRARALPPRITLTAGAAVLIALAATGLFLAADSTRLVPLAPAAAEAASWLGYNDTPQGHAQFGTGRCFPTAINPACLASDPARPNLLLMGDSHAAQLSQALREALPGVHVIQATAIGCRPLRNGKGEARCRALAAAMLARRDWARIGTVVLAGRWLPEEQAALVTTARELAAHGPRVIVDGPMVEYDADLPRLLARAVQIGDPTYPARFLLRDRQALDATLARALAGVPVRYVSPWAYECPAGQCRAAIGNGVPRHFDDSHFTAPAARDFVAHAIMPQLR